MPAAAASRGGFTRGYWLVVAGEVVALAAGLALINGPLAAPKAAVAWVSFVVGVHFVALALVWHLRLFHALGVAPGVCGLLGLVLATTGSTASAINLTAGGCPGRDPARVRPVGQHPDQSRVGLRPALSG